MRFPITLYTEDPEKIRFAECHEVCYAFESKAHTYVLLDKHGWWDTSEQEAHFKADILVEPMKNEADASTAMDARVRWLEQRGWTHRFTPDLESRTGMLVPKRIPDPRGAVVPW